MRTDHKPLPAVKADPSWRVAIIHSSFYPEEVGTLVAGAREALIAAGIDAKNVTDYPVSGSFEIPLIGAVLAQEKKADALIGLGIIVEGETHHARLIAGETARGIMDVQVTHGMPFAFEVLYVKKLSQAKVRSAGSHNKGGEAARAVLHSLAQIAGTRE